MEYITEIINIIKIKDGFFIGDRTVGTNLDVVLQFKISHKINTSGNQILNQFETIGVQYLNLNLSEKSSQKLLDSKNGIQNKIITFIDDAMENGEGLLVFSVENYNCACIIVIIYFMIKYCWSLNKCIEFLMVKKKDLNIPFCFIKQLSEYEEKIKYKLSKEWYNLNNIKDKNEFLIRNTYLNSLVELKNKNNNINYIDNNKLNYKYNPKPHVRWGDNNSYNKLNGLIIYNNQNDLILKTNIKDIVSHLRFIPKKKCIINSNQLYKYGENFDIKNDYNSKNYIINNKNNSFNNCKIEINNLNNLNNLGININIINKINQINNNFNNLILPRQKSNSVKKYNKKTKNYNCLNNNNNDYNDNDIKNNSFTNNKINDNKFVKINNYFVHMKKSK